ncbi:ABC transporter substrate-binding protein [Paenibacillus sp.]|uniref:ABC transporter substrate-binding protein n=1 Tax=Paenibacillus sp. TaxID=58172 RepID=UPI002D359E9D|nr:ABC transporter substrate-binding protein [Paenibacillus sp.]HZG84041.1 ABC transporter substrate-binding protein [Paenibacillus sp.]
MNKSVKAKALAIILTIMMTVLLTACSPNQGSNLNASSNESESSTQTTNEPPVELVMSISSELPADTQLVLDELNKYLIEKVNAKLKIIGVPFGSYSQQINLMMTGQEQLDLMITGPALGFVGQAGKNQLTDLDEYLRSQGQGILDVADKDMLKVGQVNGKTYAIPIIGQSVQGKGLILRKDLADKYNIDMTKIKTVDDVEPVLQILKENEPDLIPLVPTRPGVSIVQYFETGDNLSDDHYIGFLPNFDNGLKIVNYYETQEYKDLVNRMKKWYDAGYLLKDGTTNNEQGKALVLANRAAAVFGPIGVESDAAYSKNTFGTEVVRAMISEPSVTTATASQILWSIPRHSKHPEKAMEVLNLMYTDATFLNLLVYGIEGKHYIKLDDGRIDFPEGMTRKNSPYPGHLYFLFGNVYLNYVKVPVEADIHERRRASYEQAIKSKALGFNFDTTPVKTKYAAVVSVVNKYKLGLESGMLDPEKVLPEFISQLKTAGIDEIIAEKQKQLDEWAATSK